MKRFCLLIPVRSIVAILASLPLLANAAGGSAGPCTADLPLAHRFLSSLPADDGSLMPFNLTDNGSPGGPPSSKGTHA